MFLNTRFPLSRKNKATVSLFSKTLTPRSFTSKPLQRLHLRDQILSSLSQSSKVIYALFTCRPGGNECPGNVNIKKSKVHTVSPEEKRHNSTTEHVTLFSSTMTINSARKNSDTSAFSRLLLPLALQSTAGFGVSNNVLPFFSYLPPTLSIFSLPALERSLSTSSFHLFLGLPLLLVPSSS